MGFFKSAPAKNERAIENEKILAALDRSQATISFDPDGTILHANENFLNLLGYREPEIQGRHHSLFVGEEEKSSPEYASFWQQLANGYAQVRQFKRISKDGRELWIEASYNPLQDEQGRVYKVVKFATDITATRMAATLSTVLRNCQANVIWLDQQQRVKYLNNAAEQLFKRYQTALSDHIAKEVLANLQGALISQVLTGVPEVMRLVTGLSGPQKCSQLLGDIAFDIIFTPMRDEKGRANGTLVEITDMSAELKRQQAEQKAAAENARVRVALDVTNACVMLLDTDVQVIYANGSIVKMFKHREAQLKTKFKSFNPDALHGYRFGEFCLNSQQCLSIGELSTPSQLDLEVGDLTFGLLASPVFNPQGERLGTIVEWQDKTDVLAQQRRAQTIADENERVRQALDCVSTNVMIADNDAHVIYYNSALESMMQKAETDIKKVLPHFDVKKLKGVNMDIFHKNASHQRGIINNLTTTYRGKAEVGGRTFTVIASPIVSDGKRLGTVVEWADRTAETSIEGEVDAMIAAAARGDFTKQIALDGKDGFILGISKSLNELVSTVEIALNDMLRMLGAMAKGNLSERITRDYSGVFGQLRQDANFTADKLTEIISKIRQSAGSIHTAANEIAQGNADLSQRTEEQASSLEETASSMEEMTSTVRQSADNAQKANDLALQAQSRAKTGGDVVSRAVQAMEDINAASKKIADIIGVIDEIAFQTNLLALNAAVEAARAGEQGRGFAVVAGEVRNLAQRSAGAAKEIKELIRDSVHKVQDGRELVNESGKTLGEIVTAVEVVCQMIRDIASAAREQTAGIEQVNTAISQMDEMTQQNAALVEQATAASQSMVDQANDMGQLVSFFSVGHTAAMASHAPQAVARHAPVKPAVKKTKAVKSIKLAAPPAGDEWEDF
ncbi:MAG: methyl-accepting chemotaxis protein [Marinagarivorans sp.]